MKTYEEALGLIGGDDESLVLDIAERYHAIGKEVYNNQRSHVLVRRLAIQALSQGNPMAFGIFCLYTGVVIGMEMEKP